MLYISLVSSFIVKMIGDFLLSFFITFFGIKYLILFLKKQKKFQPIRKESVEEHIKKNKTPTMGGLIISLSIILNTVIFCDIYSTYVKIGIYIILIFSTIGLIDDIIKVVYNNVNGFQGSRKLILQLSLTFISMIYLCYTNLDYLNTGIKLPIFNITIPFYTLTPLIYTLIICGSSNASNITDGLDGLLSVPVISISLSIIIISKLLINGINFSDINLDKELLENIILILISVIGSFSAFLIYNMHPAKIFIGDVGSLTIGALLCYIAILIKIEIPYAIMALLFIIEIFSSILQVSYFKITKGKRIFKMAPIHHHLEKCGWSETKIVKYAWYFSVICCITAVMIVSF